MDVFGDLLHVGRDESSVLGEPVDAGELDVAEVVLCEFLDDHVDIPFAGGYAVRIVAEIHRFAVDLAPVGLTLLRFGHEDHDLAAVERTSDLVPQRSDGSVERRDRVRIFEVEIHDGFPVLLVRSRAVESSAE